jgi:hypothetical protein
VTNHADLPPTAEPYSIADLAVDAADVRRVLHLENRAIRRPDRHPVAASGVIPSRALALVAGLDSYGD